VQVPTLLTYKTAFTNTNELVAKSYVDTALNISLYTLPKSAPAVGQVITCSSLGVSNWITPSPTAFGFVYPYPTSIYTNLTLGTTKTYCVTYTMTTNITFANASMFYIHKDLMLHELVYIEVI
jgi:hypothetical protein